MADRLELSKAHLRMQEALKDPNLIDQFCYRVAEGEAPKEICDSWRLPYGMVSKWIAEDEERNRKYEVALSLKAENHAHEALQIADEADSDSVPKARLQVETRLKLAGKWNPKRYGGEKDFGGGGVGPITIQIGTVSSPYDNHPALKDVEGEVVSEPMRVIDGESQLRASALAAEVVSGQDPVSSRRRRAKMREKPVCDSEDARQGDGVS